MDAKTLINFLLKAYICFNLTVATLYAFVDRRYQTLVISFDGMQSAKFEDFLKKTENCAINKIIKNGVKAEYMIPSFPSYTFPNHFTLVTGRYIESHGIVANTIYDPKEDARVGFIGGNTTFTLNPKWWNQAEPIWLTAKNQGLKTASYFWVGSEVNSRTPDIWMTYNQDYPDRLRIDAVVNWIHKLKIDLTFLYFHQPDSAGHEFGPDSEIYMEKIKTADENIEYLVSKLQKLNIYDDLNILILSDHGMATMKNQSTIFIQHYVDMKLINANRTIYGATANVHPIAGYEQEVFVALKKIPNAKVYYKHQIPEDLHYSNNDRIAPIVVLCDEGFVLNTNQQYARGSHGYDNKIESMRTVFIATGPNFKKDEKIQPFQNVNVYPLLCKLLQINCKPNNGTLETFAKVLEFRKQNKDNQLNSLSTKQRSYYIILTIIFQFLLLKFEL